MKNPFPELKRPLVVLDLETTGTWVEKDKIIEIAMVKCSPGGETASYAKKVNPGISIPDAVVQLTGITNEQVRNAPPFRDIAREVLDFMEQADLGGFNADRFDLPLLEREMAEAGQRLEWKSRGVYDAQKVYHLNEKRDLTAAYKFYCGKDLVNAHSALADTEATLEILAAQLQRYCAGGEGIEALKTFAYEPRAEFYDDEKKLRWWNDDLYFNFGKYRKMTLRQVARQDRDYLIWMMGSDMGEKVKTAVRQALEGRDPLR